MEKRESPLCFRANEEDKEILSDLQKRLGLKMPQVLKLAIRRLRADELRRGKK